MSRPICNCLKAVWPKFAEVNHYWWHLTFSTQFDGKLTVVQMKIKQFEKRGTEWNWGLNQVWNSIILCRLVTILSQRGRNTQTFCPEVSSLRKAMDSSVFPLLVSALMQGSLDSKAFSRNMTAALALSCTCRAWAPLLIPSRLSCPLARPSNSVITVTKTQRNIREKGRVKHLCAFYLSKRILPMRGTTRMYVPQARSFLRPSRWSIKPFVSGTR